MKTEFKVVQNHNYVPIRKSHKNTKNKQDSLTLRRMEQLLK